MAKRTAAQRKLEAHAINTCYHSWARPLMERVAEDYDGARKDTKDPCFEQLSDKEKVAAFWRLSRKCTTGSTLTVPKGSKMRTLHAGVDLGVPLEELGTPYVLTDEAALLSRDPGDADLESRGRISENWLSGVSPLFGFFNTYLPLCFGGDDFHGTNWRPAFRKESLDETFLYTMQAMARGFYQAIDDDAKRGGVRLVPDPDGQLYRAEEYRKVEGMLKASVSVLDDPSVGDPIRNACAEEMGGFVEALLDEIDYAGTPTGGIDDEDVENSAPRIFPAGDPTLSVPCPRDAGGAAEWDHTVRPARRRFFLDRVNAEFAVACLACDLSGCVTGLGFTDALRLLITGTSPDMRRFPLFTTALPLDCGKGSEGFRGVGRIGIQDQLWLSQRTQTLFDYYWDNMLEKVFGNDAEKRPYGSWMRELHACFVSALLMRTGGLSGKSKRDGAYFSSSRTMRRHLDDERNRQAKAAEDELIAAWNDGVVPDDDAEREAVLASLAEAIEPLMRDRDPAGHASELGKEEQGDTTPQ